MTPTPRLLLAFAWAAAALLAGPYVASAEGEPDGASSIVNDDIGVLRLFDEFVSSGAAASRCASPDDVAAARFLSNFQWVSAHATREIGRQMPTSSPEEVAAELARRSQEVKARAHALVKAEGCESASVQELVRRFAVQATWRREG
jgi:hypothetical protein